MSRTVLSFCLALCVLAAPSIAAESKATTPVNRMLKLMDSTYARFAKQADRSTDSALRRIDTLERAEATDERIQAVIDETKASLEASAASMRRKLEDFNTATDLVIDRHEQTSIRERIIPTINFDELRRRADRKTDSLDARADLLLDDAFATLDDAAPVAEAPEEGF